MLSYTDAAAGSSASMRFWTTFSFSAGDSLGSSSIPARGASLMTESWEKYLTPQPMSPLHSSAMASGAASTGTKASSLSQPVIRPSSSTKPTASLVPMAMPKTLGSPRLIMPARADTSPSLATSKGTSPKVSVMARM